MATYRTTPTVPADIVTYRMNEKLVFVKPAENYEQALDVAQKEFPDELRDVTPDRISFIITATMGGEKRAVRISESAWAAAVARLLRGEVIDIQVRPDITALDAKALESKVLDAPPQYLEVPDSKEALEFSRTSRSCPTSRPHSRQSSPSSRSVKSDDKSSRGWFGKHF